MVSLRDTINLPKGFKATAEQKKAYETIKESTRSVFISGRAGTGKSTFIEYFKKKTKKNYIVLTFTGLAAVLNKGKTIHSFFQFPHGFLSKNDKRLRTISKREGHIKSLDVIIIDEISTVRVDLLNSIDYILRKYRGNNLPFGGIQMMFVGDIFQIAPIEPRKQSEWDAFRNDYKDIWFFNAEGFKSLDLQYIQFDKVHRQKDKVFRDRLLDIREGAVNRSVLDFFNQRVGIQPPSNAIALCPTNKLVDEYNKKYLSQLPGKEYSFIATHKKIKDKDMPTDRELRIKVNARVMLLNNDQAGRWVNGTIGKVDEIKKNRLYIKVPTLKEGEYSKSYEIERYTWKTTDWKRKKVSTAEGFKYEYEPIVDGYFKQFPIKLCRATTIHKSQGQTFNNVLLDLGQGAFAHGQTYVALSRVREIEGLYLKVPIYEEDVQFDEAIYQYYHKHLLI